MELRSRGITLKKNLIYEFELDKMHGIRTQTQLKTFKMLLVVSRLLSGLPIFYEVFVKPTLFSLNIV